MKTKNLIIGLMAVCCMTACSNDNEEDPIGGNGSRTEGTMELDILSQQDFSGFVANNIFQFDSYSLSNIEIAADTRAVLPPMIYQDTEGKWLDYCPTSFWIKDNELYCSAKMDYATYEQWQEYTKSHKVELYVHSPFQYNEADGSLKTNAHVMPAEKQNLVYRMGLNGNNMEDMVITLHLMLDNPLLSDYDGVTKYYHMHINYKRVSLNSPFNTELKVFETNDEAVAYAKELMAK
ncbi:MAG: hypothetical protein ILA03_08640 [Bacteroidaceae bacterium]|nr:hypothetical protein [Bacteroidaceae bacterium]MBP3834014.1 hypothetical protein [Bacteroidaceae bacterium]